MIPELHCLHKFAVRGHACSSDRRLRGGVGTRDCGFHVLSPDQRRHPAPCPSGRARSAASRPGQAPTSAAGSASSRRRGSSRCGRRCSALASRARRSGKGSRPGNWNPAMSSGGPSAAFTSGWRRTGFRSSTERPRTMSMAMHDGPASVALLKGRRRRRQKEIPASRNDGRRANRSPGAGIRENCADRGPDATVGRQTGQRERRHRTPASRLHRAKPERRTCRRSGTSRIAVACQCLAC